MMKKLPILLLSIFILLSACNRSTPTPSLAERILLQPTATPTYTPVPTSTELSTGIPPTPTTDPNFFRDDFNGALNSQWHWIHENPRSWSLTAVPGSLQINVEGGYVAQNTHSNLLLHPAPAGDFQIETQINFNPEDNFQFAGLIIYDSTENFIQAGRGYCKSFECAGRGLYMNYYKKGVVVKPNFGQAYRDSSSLLIRLSRRGENYTFEASADGKVWFLIGRHTSDIKPAQVGLVSGQKIKGDVLPAVFSYFELKSLP